nr:MAG TPA: hypothetical protein [Caudoviricetes sp.]
MRLIDSDKLVDMLYDNEYTILCPLDEVSGVIDNCPTVGVVSLSDLLELRDWLYEHDAITMEGLAQLNQLIAGCKKGGDK